VGLSESDEKIEVEGNIEKENVEKENVENDERRP
jgi:hypothetical protein